MKMYVHITRISMALIKNKRPLKQTSGHISGKYTLSTLFCIEKSCQNGFWSNNISTDLTFQY